MRLSRSWLLTLALLAHAAPHASAQDGFASWVGLWTPDMLGWLENENRIGQLCTDSMTMDVCYAEKLGPKIATHGLYAGPGATERRVGDLIVAAVPGKGLTAHYRPAGDPEARSFPVDLFLQDWGYGTYFHQTFSERRGTWFRLPPDPWDGAVWLHLELPQIDVFAVLPGTIVELDGEGWYVVEAEGDALVVRPEQPADMWCELGEPPAFPPIDPTRWTRRDLVDARGHLKVRPKYMKGC